MAKNEVSFRLHTQKARRLAARLVREGNRFVAGAVEESTMRLEDTIKNEVLNQSGSGRLYRSKRGTTSGTHRASAPGEPPAPDTNTYRQSWSHEVLGGGLRGLVFTTDDRGPMLEFGTRHMDPRPHAEPAFKRHQPVHHTLILKALRKAVRTAKL